MNNKTVICRAENATAYCEFKNDKPIRSDIFTHEEKNILGNIYVGYVKDIVKNINAAFVEYEPGKKAYLQLSDNNSAVFLNVKNTDKFCEGDRVIIQISKEAIKTKDPVCTCKFEIAGLYVVLKHGDKGLSVSKKINDKEFKDSIEKTFIDAGLLSDKYGILLRTKAYNTDLSKITEDAKKIIDEYNSIMETAKTRSKNFCLKESEEALYNSVRELEYDESDRIITDDEIIFEKLSKMNLSGKIELYNDPMLPLYKLYSLETIFSEINSRKVWMKSGAYLVIDYTEAMTVIDVNTGKCDKGKDKESTFLKINLEAAAEIARQLSLRNISGIIIVDFIDMQSIENRNELFLAMKKLVSEDKIKTNVVDFTRLNLMEITRKKTRDLVRGNVFFNKKE